MVVGVLNSAWIGIMYVFQLLDEKLPPRGSLIPGTKQPFLYMGDWRSMTWGDTLGVLFILNAFAHLVAHGHISSAEWLVIVVLAAAIGEAFFWMCLGENHKPDQGFPKAGKWSWHGLSHVPYLGAAIAMGISCLWHIFMGELRGPVLYAGLAGLALYAVSVVADIKAGNFAPLKKIEFEDPVPVLFGEGWSPPK